MRFTNSIVRLAITAAALGMALTCALAQETMIKNATELKFGALPNVPGCATATVLNGDPAKGAAVMMLKAVGGCVIPWHWHTPNEEVMVASGIASFQMKDGKAVLLRSGGYAFLPAHHAHQFSCSAGPCMGFIHSDGVFDLHYVDDSGKEISMEQAVKHPKSASAHAKMPAHAKMQ